MKKNELKSGMIVEYRNGNRRLVVNDDLIGSSGAGFLSYYDDDLKYVGNDVYDVLDIIKVYKYKYCMRLNRLLEDDSLDLIWERKEIKLTDKEIEILKALKLLGFNFLARDENNDLYAYSKKPFILSLSIYWVTGDDEYVKVNSDAFTFIKWTDKEPTKINIQ